MTRDEKMITRTEETTLKYANISKSNRAYYDDDDDVDDPPELEKAVIFI